MAVLCVPAGAWGVPNPAGDLNVREVLSELDLEAVHRGAKRGKHDRESGGGPRILGLQASLPVDWARTSVEYSLLAPESSVAYDPARSYGLFRARLDTRLKSADLGVRYFSVGDAFAGDALGDQRLAEVGLGTVGEGAEAWARWTVQGLTLQPRIRQVTVPQRRGEESKDELQLQVERRLGDAARLVYAYETLDVERDLDTAAPGTRSDLDRHRVRLGSGDWYLDWTRQERVSGSEGAASPTLASLQKLAARFRVSDDLTVLPLVSREEILGAPGLQTVRDAGQLSFSYGTSWRWVPEVDLRFGYEGVARGEQHQRALDAGVSFRTYLGFGTYQPERTVLGVSFGYQRSDGELSLFPEEGVEVELKLEHRPRG